MTDGSIDCQGDEWDEKRPRLAMLAKLQTAAAVKRQQRIETSVVTIQNAWRHRTQAAVEAVQVLRSPPPLPVRPRGRRGRRGGHTSGMSREFLAGTTDDAVVLQPEGARQNQARSLLTTAEQLDSAQIRCIRWLQPGHKSALAINADELRLSPVYDGSAAPQSACAVRPSQSVKQRLISPPPLPARRTILTRLNHKNSYGASTGSDRFDAARPPECGSSCDDSYVVNNDIYKLLR